MYKNNAGDSKYTAIDEEYDRELLDEHNMNEDDMWDDMVDIRGNKHRRYVEDYSDEEVWEVDSDAYSKRSVSDSDDISIFTNDEISSFINDDTTDYETNDDTSSEDSS